MQLGGQQRGPRAARLHGTPPAFPLGPADGRPAVAACGSGTHEVTRVQGGQPVVLLQANEDTPYRRPLGSFSEKMTLQRARRASHAQFFSQLSQLRFFL